MFEKIEKLASMFDFNSEEITFVFDNIVSKELQYFSDVKTVINLAKSAHKIRLPYKSFWKSFSNLLLMKYHEMDFYDIV